MDNIASNSTEVSGRTEVKEKENEKELIEIPYSSCVFLLGKEI